MHSLAFRKQKVEESSRMALAREPAGSCRCHAMGTELHSVPAGMTSPDGNRHAHEPWTGFMFVHTVL